MTLTRAILDTARIVKEEGDAEVMAALTFTLSDVRDDAFYTDLARQPGRRSLLLQGCAYRQQSRERTRSRP
jgi:hypothetical protein